MKNVWVVISAYNEESYIFNVLKGVLKSHNQIVIVDDGSTDKTPKIAKRISPNTIIHETNLGKGAAMKTGADFAFQEKKATAVIFMDGDNQHDPLEIKKFIKSLDDGNDVVLGVRQLKANMPLMRFLGNKSASILINLLMGKYFADIPSGFKAMTKKAYSKINWESQSYEVETEICVKIAKYKLKHEEIPIKTIYHDADKGFTMIDAARILLKLPQWIWR